MFDNFLLSTISKISLAKRFCLDCQSAGASTMPGKIAPERKDTHTNEFSAVHYGWQSPRGSDGESRAMAVYCIFQQVSKKIRH